METKRKDIKYQLQQEYKLQTIMHYVNREMLIKQHEREQEKKESGIDGVAKEEYDFLGFTFSNSKALNGKYRPNIRISKKKLKQKFEVVKKWLHDKIHDSLLEVALSIKRNHAYYGIKGNYTSLVKFYKYVKYTWYYTLRKRDQKNKIKYFDYLRIWNYLEIPKHKIYVNI